MEQRWFTVNFQLHMLPWDYHFPGNIEMCITTKNISNTLPLTYASIGWLYDNFGFGSAW